jgi:hypothetical protein
MSDYNSDDHPVSFGRPNLPSAGQMSVGNPVATRNPFAGLLRLIGDEAVIRSLNSQARVAAALTCCLNEQTKSVLAKDALETSMEKYHAHRAGILNPVEQEEMEEERHKRMLARLRRERQIYDAKQETMESLHKLEATEEFKEQKFAAGRARYGAKIAERQVGEAVARSSMEPEPKEAPAPEKPVSIEAVLADFAHKLEQDIDQAEAMGKSTKQMREDLAALSSLLKRL